MSTRLPFETDGGAGEKAALGLIVLQSDETMEREFRPLFEKADVALYHSRIPSAPEVSAASLAEMAAEMMTMFLAPLLSDSINSLTCLRLRACLDCIIDFILKWSFTDLNFKYRTLSLLLYAGQQFRFD